MLPTGTASEPFAVSQIMRSLTTCLQIDGGRDVRSYRDHTPGHDGIGAVREAPNAHLRSGASITLGVMGRGFCGGRLARTGAPETIRPRART